MPLCQVGTILTRGSLPNACRFCPGRSIRTHDNCVCAAGAGDLPRSGQETMKRFAKRLFNRLARSISEELQLERGATLRPTEAVAQKMLIQQYRALAARGKDHLPSFND